MSEITEVLQPFKPLPWQVAPWRDKSPILLLTGSAGGGKSSIAAEKIHAFCLKYPGATGLMLRKARTWMTNSTLLFMERQVIGSDSRVRHFRSRFRFEYDNGSILAYGGMMDDDQREAIRSIGQTGGLDIIWLEEANSFLEADLNELIPRLRGQAAPWRQLMLTTNPDSDMHWIYTRLIQGGEATVYYSSATDNIHNPDDYISNLNKLTGVERLRLHEGKWVRAQGIVYDKWLDGPADGHVTEEAEYIPNGGPVYWGVDDGYAGALDAQSGRFKAGSHPRVFLLCQLRGSILHVFNENYAIETKAAQQIYDVLEMQHSDGTLYAEPEYTAVDKSAAALKGELHDGEWKDRRWQLFTRNSPSRVNESIKVVREWLAADSNGIKRILVHPRCVHLRSEMASYATDPKTGKIIKEFDHGPDALRALVWNLRVI